MDPVTQGARDRFIAWIQATLTFVLVLAFIWLLATGKADAATAIKDFAGMAVMFWLMRHRQATSSSADDTDPPAAEPPTTTVRTSDPVTITTPARGPR